MTASLVHALDLNPPPFAEGLCDWSRGDGGPASPTYETGEAGRIARNDPDFADCLELRKAAPVQRLRYMGELPLRASACVEVRARIKALRGPLPAVRIAASAGAAGGVIAAEFAGWGPAVQLAVHGAVVEVRATIGRRAGPGVDIVWGARALYAHIGLDLIGPDGCVLRIENLQAREVRRATQALPGFEIVDA